MHTILSDCPSHHHKMGGGREMFETASPMGLIIHNDPGLDPTRFPSIEEPFHWILSNRIEEILPLINECQLAIIFHQAPTFDGLAFMPLMRSHGIPSILVAETFQQDLMLEAMQAGVIDYLVAPVEKEKLESCFNRMHHNGLLKQNDKSSQQLQSSGNPRIEGNFLGNFQPFIHGEYINCWPSKRSKSLFAYLMYFYKKRIPRDVLMETFWPYATVESARKCLNVAIYSIRKTLQKLHIQQAVIRLSNDCYFIDPDVEIQLDVETFTKAIEKAQQAEFLNGLAAARPYYEVAKKAYTGEFLEEYRFESWTLHAREMLQEKYLHVVEKLGAAYLEEQRFNEAIAMYKQLLVQNNYREDIHRQLMKTYHLKGRRDLALLQYKKCTTVLAEELQVAPQEGTVRLFQSIKNLTLIPDIKS